MTVPHPNTRLRPVIRVFASSTFSDMGLERNALQEHVYPKLEQLCSLNGFQFQAIDLRWGVSSEAGLDHRTMRICFEELRRSQEVSPEPNFLILLGNRYGWRPLPEEISQVEFEKLLEVSEAGGENQPLIPGTHGKTARQVLCEWYRCDKNVLLPTAPEIAPDRAPLNYILQPRTRNLGDGRDYTRAKDEPPKDTQDWLDVQQVLWRIINVAFPAEPLDHRFKNIDWSQHVANVHDTQHPKRTVPQIVRFQASATEQEIWCGALSAPNAERHVLAFFRGIANRDEFAPADVKDFFDQTEAGAFDETAATRQAALKVAIGERLGKAGAVPIPFARLKHENGKIVVDALKEDILKFCDSVETRLRSIIERQIKQYWHETPQASAERALRELEIEQQEHARVSQERGGAETFVGRQDRLEAIRNYLCNDFTWPLVVYGASGCGKTALLARAAQEAKALEPVVRLIGIHPRSSDLRGLLSSLCQELRLRHPREGELPMDIKLLEAELHEHFREAAKSEQPLILFLDALDQLADTDGGRLLHWIPVGPLPAHVRLVVSCLSDRADGDPAGQPYAELRRRALLATHYINLDPFSGDDARTLLFDRWLPQAGRTVSPGQRARIEQRLASEECRQPIYLKLLFEEVRLWRFYGDDDDSPELGGDVPALLRQLFDRLSRPENHGHLLVERILGYLAASRDGLAENEILEILFRDPEYKTALDDATKTNRHEMPPNAKRIPIAIWSRLRFDLASYLTERAAIGANVLTFYHRQVVEWVPSHFGNLGTLSWQPHRRLAEYFRKLADPKNDKTWLGMDRRAFEQLPYHLSASHQEKELRELLTNLAYLDGRVILSGPTSLLATYLEIGSPAKDIQAWQAYLLAQASSLRLVPSLLPSLASNHGQPFIKNSVTAYLQLAQHRHSWLKLDDLPPVHVPSITDSTIPLPFKDVCSCDEIRTTIAAIILKYRFGVFLKTIGKIAVLDFETGTIFNDCIDYPLMARPLSIAASSEGRWIALVDEVGKGVCLNIEWRTEVSMTWQVVAVHYFECFLPEIENPEICFAFEHLWWQDRSGCLVFWKPGSPNIGQSTRLKGELRYICVVNNKVVALDVCEKESTVVVLNSDGASRRQLALPLRLDRMCLYSNSGLMLLAFDGTTYLLPNLSDELVNGPLVSGAVTNMFPVMDGVYFETPTRCYLWSGHSTDCVKSCKTFKIGSGSILAFAEYDDILYVIKKAGAFRATRQRNPGCNVASTANIHALCPHSSGTSYSALLEIDNMLYTSGPEPQQAQRRGHTASASSRNAIANSGQLAWPETPGHLALWTPPHPPISINVNGLGAVLFLAAGKQGEYWLVNDENVIWTINTQGQGKKLASVGSVTRPSPHRLLVSDKWLIWCGTSMGDDKRQSPDHLDTVDFYHVKGEINHRTLIQAGHHFFEPENGKWTLTLWDEIAGELACFFQLLGDKRFFARVGTPEAIMHGQERIVALPIPELLLRDLEAGTSFANGQGWLVRSRTGWLTALESTTFRMLGAYPIGVTGTIASQAGHSGTCLVSMDNTVVANCSLINIKGL